MDKINNYITKNKYKELQEYLSENKVVIDCINNKSQILYLLKYCLKYDYKQSFKILSEYKPIKTEIIDKIIF